MRTEPAGPGAFRVEFDSPDELAAIERASLGVGGLLLPSGEPLPADTLLALTLRIVEGPEVAVAARVVAALPGALALHLEGNPAEIVRALRVPPQAGAPATAPATVPVMEIDEGKSEEAAGAGSLWERLRRLNLALEAHDGRL